MSRPMLAPCASSAEYLMVPKGPPVFVLTPKVPAEHHLNHNHTVHLSNQASQLLLGLFNGFAVFFLF
jgi:hypothetical protein